jgi:endonuclease/exonuclease/phosphatase (EEP) superfamily protein YafD
MSNAQKEALAKLGKGVQQAITWGILSLNAWFLSDVYQDLKEDYRHVKADVQTLKENDRAQSTAIEFLKDQVKR